MSFEGRSRVSMRESAMVYRDDFIRGQEESGVDRSLNSVGDDAWFVHRFHGGFRDFEHE